MLKKWIKAFQDKREARRKQTVNNLTVKYQLFRGLLDNNDEAVSLLAELDLLSHSDIMLKDEQPRIIQMVDAVEEMIELLNQLDGSHQNLYVRFQSLRRKIEEKLPSFEDSELAGSIVNLKEVSPQNLAHFGNKAAVLAKFSKVLEFNVPSGFVVTNQACLDFLRQNQIFARIHQLIRPFSAMDEIPDAIVLRIQDLIYQAELPAALEEEIKTACEPYFDKGKGLAIRSSSRLEDTTSHSFAGQYDTVLNITDHQQALSAFRRVVASNYNSRCLAYRQRAGIPRLDFDMAVLFLEMVDAQSAGVMLTRNPATNYKGMVISATFGLGEAVVSGSLPTDIYCFDENGHLDKEKSVIETKTSRVVSSSQGGIVQEQIPTEQQTQPVLSDSQLKLLFEWGSKLEQLQQKPQDIEWAFDFAGRPVLLQSRPLVTPHLKEDLRKENPVPQVVTGQMLHIRGKQDLSRFPDFPVILALRQSIPDVARTMDRVAGLLIENGNPTDHLALVAREYGVPILYGKKTEGFNDVSDAEIWLTMFPGEHNVRVATEDEIKKAKATKQPIYSQNKAPVGYSPGSLGELLFPLHLTDAYGPTFSFAECKSLHDVVRYAHEKGVLAMFDAGDDAVENGGVGIHLMDIEAPFPVSIVDLGGGLIPGEKLKRFIQRSAVQSHPLQALLDGVCTKELNWGPAPGGGNLGSVMSRWMLDKRSARPIGLPNYAMITRDYLNLNARMDFHFTMIDSVCGFTSETNYIHFRFNGGGTDRNRRARRAKCIRLILEHYGFFTDLRNDLVNATIHGGMPDTIREKLAVLGQLLGFTRLLDAAMHRDDMVELVVDAFINQDFQMSFLNEDEPASKDAVKS